MKQTPITNPDPNNTDLRYWDKVLASHGLSMERARRSRIQVGSREERQQSERTTYVGGSQDLANIEEKHVGVVKPVGGGWVRNTQGGRRVRPEGQEPDGMRDDDNPSNNSK